MRISILVISIILFSNSLFASNKISGKISDQDGNPLPGARIYLPELHKGAISDKLGNYKVGNLPDGNIKIQFSYVGYANKIESLELKSDINDFNIIMQQSVVEAEEIVVTGGFNSTQHENAVNIEVLKLNSLSNKSTPNLSEMLTKVPGVDMISKGSGVAKPVIRGLSANDILVLNNGVRFENYQYSSHHPLGIDEFGIEDVEIIKGPASLIYGSDAIGGVINFIKEKPAQENTLVGDYNLQLFSNTLGYTNNLGLSGATKDLFGGIRFGQKSNADFLQGGGDFVPNSRFNEYSLKTNIGLTNTIGTFKLYYDYNNQKLGLVEDEAVESISERARENNVWYQQFNTHLISSQNKLYLGKYKLDINSSYQNTELIHFGEENIYEIQMALATFNYEIKVHFPADLNSEYIIGLQGFNQKNTNLNDRETKLLPDATTDNYSIFGLFQNTFFEKLKFQAGLRYDFRNINTISIGQIDDTLAYRPALNNNYGSMSGSVGATYNFSEELLLRTNFAAAFRTPNLAELTSNGIHELRFEIGNPNLSPQNAYETDINLHFHRENITFDIAGFYNIINNYIFITPTGLETTAQIPIYKYKQSNSVLYGFEVGLHIHPEPVKWLHFETTFASVTGKQENGDYLPFIPANKLNFELRIENDEISIFRNSFISINSSTAFDQNLPAPDETATDGYTLIDLNIGTNIKINNQLISLSLGANNILDEKYIDHLSTLKEVNFFNPGRNLTMTLKIPFDIIAN
jgi:iron complex outermembrane receptor protein